MKIIFTIESLHFGGKERRFIELIQQIEMNHNIEYLIIVLNQRIDFDISISIKNKITIFDRKLGKKTPGIFLKYFKIINKFNPEIIHSWGNTTSIYSLPAAKIYHKIFITSEITDSPSKIPLRFLSHRIVFPFANKIISNSQIGLETYKAPRKKSVVIRNGFNFERLAKIEKNINYKSILGIKNEFVVTMIANFSKRKDYVSYIKAAINILNVNQELDICFLCIGGGDSSYEESIIPNKNKNNIKFLGSRTDIENIISVTDIGILSTYTEGISNAIIEFMAQGIPVIATEGGGTKELVINNITGFLISQENPKLLAEKILLLIQNFELRKKMGAVSIETISSNYSIDKMYKTTIDLYMDLLNKKSK